MGNAVISIRSPEPAPDGASSEGSTGGSSEEGQTSPPTRSAPRAGARAARPSRGSIRLRCPERSDAADIWQLVRDSGQLDLNSPYAYLLLCTDFADTCIVAEQGDDLVGFIGAYRPPGRRDVLFVWQVVSAKQAQGRGVATKMLDALLSWGSCRDVVYLEATVTPSNRGSRRLFERFAQRKGAEHVEYEDFEADLFPGEQHEEELRIRIGPLGGVLRPGAAAHPSEPLRAENPELFRAENR